MIQKTLDLDECLRVLPNVMLDLLHVLALILHTHFSGVKSSPWKWMEQSRDNQTKHVHRFPNRANWSFPPIFHGLLLLMTNSKAWEWRSQIPCVKSMCLMIQVSRLHTRCSFIPTVVACHWPRSRIPVVSCCLWHTKHDDSIAATCCTCIPDDFDVCWSKLWRI